jgi:CRISPR-associated endonuclease Csn1
MKKNILGLDIGTNSIGWAIIEEENDTPQGIIAAGSRIIPMGTEKEEFESGNSITKNAKRRQARGARRLNQRYKLRRQRLTAVLNLLGWMPDKLGQPFTKGQQQLSTLELYGSRERALRERIELTELGRILYHLNQRRGFKSNRKANNEEITEENQETNSRITNTIEIVKIIRVTDTGEKYKNNPKYEVTLANGLVGLGYRTVFKDWEGKEVELSIKRQKTKDGETVTFSIPQKTDWVKQKEALNKSINESGDFVGTYYYHQLFNNPFYRIRENIVERAQYEKEFEAIWETQSKFHSELTDKKVVKKVVALLYPNNPIKQKELSNKTLKYIFQKDIIYYQRPLKSQVSSISDCRFEGQFKKKVAPKSSPAFQEFRIWQQINNLKVQDKYGYELPITDEQKEKLFELFDSQKEVSHPRIYKELKISSNDYTINFRDEKALDGNTTKHAFRKVFDEYGFDGSALLNNPEKLYLLWHILYSIEDNKDILTAFANNSFDFPEPVAKALLKIVFKNEYGSLSSRAINKLLPLMKAGKYYNPKLISEYALQRIDKLLNGEDDAAIDNKFRERYDGKTEIGHFTGLPYFQACELVYGSHTDVEKLAPFDAPEKIKPIERYSLRNPIVEQVLNETLQTVKAIWTKYGKPDEIRVELARELKMNKQDREKRFKSNVAANKVYQQIIEKLKTEFSLSNPTKADVERYKLWEEANYFCVYSNQPIPRAILFDKGQVDVDHIIPKTRYFDDSFNNKVICYTKENRAKDKKTAWEYMSGKGDDKLNGYLETIKRFRQGKQRLLKAKEVPDDFVNRQKQDTQYIAKETVKQLKRVCEKVNTTSGQVTDYLKNQWGLSKVMKELILPRFKMLEEKAVTPLIEFTKDDNGHTDYKIKGYSKRFDHRHHALDALVIACTQQSHVQQLNNLNQLFNEGEKRKEAIQETIRGLRKFELPWKGFVGDAKEVMGGIIVSYKNRKRLLSKNNHKYLVFDEKTGKYKLKEQKQGSTYGVRGALHNELVFGEIKRYEKLPIDKAIFKIDAIVNPNIKLALQQRVVEYNNNIKTAQKSLKKKPIEIDGQIVSMLTCWQYRYVKRRDLGVNITLNQLKNIVDPKLKADILSHLENNMGDIKKAFNEEGLIAFNKNRKAPIFKIRTLEDGNIGEAEGKERLVRKNSNNTKLHIEKGGNYCIAVYKAVDSDERKFTVIPFFDAATIKSINKDIIENIDGYKLLFTLTHNELVYVPYPDEDITTIDWTDTRKIFQRVYRVVKFSGSDYYFQPHYFAKEISINADEKTIGEFNKGTNGTQFVIENSNINIKRNCIKITIDKLGKEIKPVLA